MGKLNKKIIKFFILVFIIIISIVILRNHNSKKILIGEDSNKQAIEESKKIKLEIEVKEETDELYRCLLIFTSNDENIKIKSIKYPEEAEKETNIIQVEEENGRSKIAIDYELVKGDLIKKFKIVTQDDQEIEKRTAYNINFNLNDGTGKIDKQTFLAGMEQKIKYEPKRTGHNLLGWYTQANGGEKVTVLVNNENADDITLYAHWQIWSHIVHYDANEGTGAPANQTKTYGQGITLSNIQPTRLGYNFINWNTKANGTGTSYSPGGNYVADQNGGTVTLYAQWKSTATANIIGYYAYPANKYSNISYGEDYFNFDITCVNGAEKLNIPINGLIPGNNYKISFTRYYEGNLGNGKNLGQFGCIMNQSIVSQIKKRLDKVSFESITTGTVQGSFTFYASSSTMYWVWSLSALRDRELGKVRLSNILIEIQ